MGQTVAKMAPSSLEATPMERPMAQQLDDLSRSVTPLEQDSTIMAVIEMSQASWLVAGVVPGIERHPLKKLEPSEVELFRLLMRWRAEATLSLIHISEPTRLLSISYAVFCLK